MIPLRIDHDELRSFEGLDISDLNVADVDYALPSGEVVKLKHYTFGFLASDLWRKIGITKRLCLYLQSLLLKRKESCFWPVTL